MGSAAGCLGPIFPHPKIGDVAFYSALVIYCLFEVYLLALIDQQERRHEKRGGFVANEMNATDGGPVVDAALE
jgi:hypothetical protein